MLESTLYIFDEVTKLVTDEKEELLFVNAERKTAKEFQFLAHMAYEDVCDHESHHILRLIVAFRAPIVQGRMGPAPATTQDHHNQVGPQEESQSRPETQGTVYPVRTAVHSHYRCYSFAVHLPTRPKIRSRGGDILPARTLPSEYTAAPKASCQREWLNSFEQLEGAPCYAGGKPVAD